MKKKYSILYLIILGILFTSCKEEIDIESIAAFENLLVVEATITNEFKYQEINIFSTYSFEEDNPTGINNASVKIIDDAQNTYNFIKNSAGKYISEVEFSAQENKTYQLFITTSDGESYTSQTTKLTGVTQIDHLYASREADNLGNETMTISVDSFDPTGNSKYYRYEYEETYKIIAPFWSPFEFKVLNREEPDFAVDRVLRTREEQTCYNTLISNTIIQTETTNLIEDKVVKFPVRIISQDNPIISHRYSLLIKQYVQSFDAYTYYNILHKLSGSENTFSQNQQGFFSGNIYSIDNPKEKVIGFFDVSSVSSKRIFFNYKDFFPDEPLPPYFTDCILTRPNIIQGDRAPFWSPLIVAIDNGIITHYARNSEGAFDLPGDDDGPFIGVTPECGDCTRLGSNIKPNFWKE